MNVFSGTALPAKSETNHTNGNDGFGFVAALTTSLSVNIVKLEFR